MNNVTHKFFAITLIVKHSIFARIHLIRLDLARYLNSFLNQKRIEILINFEYE